MVKRKIQNNMACACKNRNRAAAKATPTRKNTPASNGRLTSRKPQSTNGTRKTIIRRIGH